MRAPAHILLLLCALALPARAQWTVPDKGTAQNDIQSILFQEYLGTLSAGVRGVDAVLAGGACSAQGSPDMTVAVAKASVLSNRVLKAVAAGNATITTADSTNPRIDLVVVNSSGSLAVRAGTAAAAPKPPARTANDVVLCAVWVPANDTTISGTQITDLRVMRDQGPIQVATTGQSTTNTTNTIFTIFTVTTPNGMMLTGRQLRVRCAGNYLSNSGTPTWTFTFSYGGTTMVADATAATTADADRGAWNLDVVLHAVSASSQTLNGVVRFQTPGAKTAATTGIGDLAVVTHVVAPVRGTASATADSANQDFLVRVTHSVNNAAVETVVDYCVAHWE